MHFWNVCIWSMAYLHMTNIAYMTDIVYMNVENVKNIPEFLKMSKISVYFQHLQVYFDISVRFSVSFVKFSDIRNHGKYTGLVLTVDNRPLSTIEFPKITNFFDKRMTLVERMRETKKGEWKNEGERQDKAFL